MRVDQTYPTWTNTYADVGTYAHGRTVRSFINDIIVPAITKMEEKATEYHESDDSVDLFNLHDTASLISETLKAFCLSMNSIWERQLRAHISGVARELFENPKLIRDSQRLPWKDLNQFYHTLRGFRLDYFQSYDKLDTLQLLANVCRHGEGISLDRLSQKRPDLWPTLGPPIPGVPASPRFRADNLDITVTLLEDMGAAIEGFWEECGYIYLESLNQKHENVVKELAVLRPKWAKCPVQNHSE